MLFKHPAVLYGLFFLIVPILVHLFQLRRFSKVDFTNVAFLKPLVLQTRKSRQLKKWLTLLARLLAVACLVLAFAQPFLPGSDTATQKKQTVIYLDNSFSMQAEGANGELYKSAVTDLLQSLSPEKEFTLFTNDAVYKKTRRGLITNDLLELDYSANALSIDQALLKADGLIDEEDAVRETILISDFKGLENSGLESLETAKVQLVKLDAQNRNNISLDTAYVAARNVQQLEIAVRLIANYQVERPVTVSLNNRGILAGKTSVTLENGKGEARFNIELTEPLAGQIIIEDEGLSYDNSLNINTLDDKKISVLSVNKADGDFLDRIYADDIFNYVSVSAGELNYNLLKEQNLVILNELESLPPALVKELEAVNRTGTSIIIIPSRNPVSYGSLIAGKNGTYNATGKKITKINYDHPLLDGVFNKRVSSFQYPSVEGTVLDHTGQNSVLDFQDGRSFLYQAGNRYIFTAPLNQENTNFQNSPLIVPIFYNIGVASLPLPKLYYEVGSSDQVAIPVSIADDRVLKLSNDATEVIPRQQAFSNYVMLQPAESIDDAGLYKVLQGDEQVASLSFNYPRTESQDSSNLIDDYQGRVYDSVQQLITDLENASSINELWKYFVLGALFFLICEILILKFVK